MYVDIVISNIFNLNKHFFFFSFSNNETNAFFYAKNKLSIKWE